MRPVDTAGIRECLLRKTCLFTPRTDYGSQVGQDILAVRISGDPRHGASDRRRLYLHPRYLRPICFALSTPDMLRGGGKNEVDRPIFRYHCSVCLQSCPHSCGRLRNGRLPREKDLGRGAASLLSRALRRGQVIGLRSGGEWRSRCSNADGANAQRGEGAVTQLR